MTHGAIAVLRAGLARGAATLGLGRLHEDCSHALSRLLSAPARGPEDWPLAKTKTKALFTREAAERKTWTSDLVWLTQTTQSFGAPARPTRVAITAPADRAEARPRRGLRTRR